MTREQLLASLTATEPGGWYPDSDDDTRYMDWTSHTPGGGYQMEVGAGDVTIQMDMTRNELAALHQALTVTLLQDAR